MLVLKHIFFNSPWLYRIVSLCLGIIFVFSGTVKLYDPKKFARTISKFDLLPEFLLPPVAIGLPLVELLAGLGLIFDIRGTLTAIFGLLVLFIFVLWFGILKGLDIDCGCFSFSELKDHANLQDAFKRDLVMLVAVFYLYLFRYLRSNSKSAWFMDKN
jgi:uncharacterized membrane protein YphA (DoxX/SURF4 family)